MTPIKIQNLRFALRMSRKTPAWTATAIVTLALGIGATLAMYTLVDHVLLRPLPWEEAERLVRVYQHNESRDIVRNSVSAPNFFDWRREATSFETLAAWSTQGITLTGAAGCPQRLQATFASAELFTALRVSSAIGRTFDSSENEIGPHRVVVLSHGLFASRFGADVKAIGSTVTVDGEPFEVIGVMPQGFAFPRADEPAMWAPLAFEPDEMDESSRGAQYLRVLGRMRRGVTLDQARAEMDAIATRFREADPDDTNYMATSVFALHDDQVHEVRRSLVVLLAAVGVLLLIACANVAHLLLARLHDRRRELAVRTALGATRSQLLHQMLAEAALLAVPGAAIGLLLAQWTLDAFILFLPEALPGLEGMTVDGRIVVFTLALAALTVGIFGLLPALAGSRRLEDTLRAATVRTSAGRRRSRFGRLLIVGEVTLAVTLVAGAGLLIRSLGEMIDLDPGFRKEGVTTVRVGLPETRYDSLEKTSGFFDALLEHVRARPGVESASAVGWLPLGGLWSCSFGIEGRERGDDEPYNMGLFRPVGTHYFRTMGIPLERGRTFSSFDRADSEPVIVIDEALAAKYFPGEDPLGQKLRFHCASGEQLRTIVGIVGNVRQYQLTEELEPGYYIPYSQLVWEEMSLVLRTSADPGPIVAEIRDEVRRLDPELAVYAVESIEDRLSRALSRPRLQSLLFGGFAVLALALGAAGVYGVMSCAVARRKQEMGIRAALGARGQDLVRLVLGEGMALAGVGLVLGIALALAVARLLESFLFGIGASDPSTFAGAVLVLGGAAFFACWVPASRAGRVDVVRMLRVD